MSNLTLLQEEWREVIAATKGSIFSVVALSRKTGDEIAMTCSTSFAKHLKGGEAKYDAAAKGLVIVLGRINQPNRRGIRSIALEGIVTLRAKGNVFTVCDTCHHVHAVGASHL